MPRPRLRHALPALVLLLLLLLPPLLLVSAHAAPTHNAHPSLAAPPLPSHHPDRRPSKPRTPSPPSPPPEAPTLSASRAPPPDPDRDRDPALLTASASAAPPHAPARHAPPPPSQSPARIISAPPPPGPPLLSAPPPPPATAPRPASHAPAPPLRYAPSAAVSAAAAAAAADPPVAPAPTAPPRAALSADADADVGADGFEQVFVPLKEWKKKKLADIEQRLRGERAGAGGAEGARRAPPAAKRMMMMRRSACRPVCDTPDAVCPAPPTELVGILGAQGRCLLHAPMPQCVVARGAVYGRGEEGVVGGDGEVGGPRDARRDGRQWEMDEPSEDGDARVEDEVGVEAEQVDEEVVGAQVLEVGRDGGRVAQSAGAKSDQPGLDNQSATSVGEREDGKTITVDAKTLSGFDNDDGGDGGAGSGAGSVADDAAIRALDNQKWSDGLTSPMGALMGLPMVGDIMRSIKEASAALTASPLAEDQTPLRSNTVENRSSADAASTPDCSSSNKPTGNEVLKPTSSNRAGNSRKGSKGIDDVVAGNTIKVAGNEPAVKVYDLPTEADLYAAIPDIQVDSGLVKEKPYNFASADAGARILASSSGVAGAKNVIQGNVDKYLLAPCAGDGIGGSRWIDVELSEDVILERVETGNFEYYSSSPRKVAILGSGSYPPTQWTILGVFTFKDVRTLQSFQIEKRVVTRYLRLMFAGQQGHEYYCPISTVRAFGKNLIADWKDVFEQRKGDARKSDQMHNQAREELRAKLTRDLSSAAKPSDTDESKPQTQAGCVGENCGVRKTQLDTKVGAPPPLEGAQEAANKHTRPMQEKLEATPLAGNVVEAGAGKAPDQGPEGQRVDGGTVVEDTVALAKEAGATKEVADELIDLAKDSDHNTDPANAEDETPDEDQLMLEAMHADALSSESGDDNIFRKVTRMIRILEFNQTLTNQYIDTQLARFAKALSGVKSETVRTQESAAATEERIVELIVTLEGAIQDLRSSALKRDVIMCTLLICVAFLLGTHWVLWTAISGTRLHGRSESEVSDYSFQRSRHSLEGNAEFYGHDRDDDQLEKPDRNTQKRRKSIEVAGLVSSEFPQVSGNNVGGRGRSVSSMELSSVSRGTVTLEKHLEQIDNSQVMDSPL